MPIGPAYFYDNFDRNVVDGWGTSTSGHPWRNVFATNDVVNGIGKKHIIANLGPQQQWVETPANASARVLAKVQWITESKTDFGFTLKRVDDNNYYVARIQYDPGANANNGWLFLAGVSEGTEHALFYGSSPVLLGQNTWYWFDFTSGSDNILRVKLWQDGTAIPTTDAATSGLGNFTPKPNAGNFGTWWRGFPSAYTVNIDTLHWYTLEDQHKALPLTTSFAKRSFRGWGITDDGSLWEGHYAEDPAIFSVSGLSTFVDVDGGTKVSTSLVDTVGTVGPTFADTVSLATFSFKEATGGVFSVGARGSITVANNTVSSYQGYVAHLSAGSNLLRLYKRVGNVWTQVGTSFTLPFTVSANTRYKVRLRVAGPATSVDLRAKAWVDGSPEPVDYQVTATDLTNTVANGRPWVYTDQTVSTPITTKMHDLDVRAVSNASSRTTGNVVLAATSDTSFRFTIEHTGDDDNDSRSTVQYRVLGTDDWITFGTNLPPTNTATTPKTTVGDVTGLLPDTQYQVLVTHSDPDLVIGPNPQVVVVKTTANGVRTGRVAAWGKLRRVEAQASYTEDNNGTSTVAWGIRRFGSGAAFVAPNDQNSVVRANRFHYASWNGLDDDTVYEVQATFSDPGGVRGANPLLTTTTTLGKNIELRSISAVPQETRALVTVSYDYDGNDNATLAIRYKATRDEVWTTVPSGAVSVDRTAKIFYATVEGLRPNTAYQVLANVSDPDGLLPGSPDFIEGTFNTKGEVRDPERRGKHFVYRVYNREGVFLGTWPDASPPEFGYDENGGVSDLTVRLPRKIAQLGSNSSIQMLHRVDVWAIHPSGDGMGPNMVIDEDIDKGMWTLGQDWSIDTDGGPDNGRALRFSSTFTAAKTTRSEYVETRASVPLVCRLMAKARGGYVRMYLEAYDNREEVIDQGPSVETVGSDWQSLRVEYTPPPNTVRVRLCVENNGAGTMWVDKASMRPKELLVYRGRIEAYTPSLKNGVQEVSVQVLGLVSILSDQYVSHAQYVWLQPQNDVVNKKPRRNPTDPAQMMRDTINDAKRANPYFPLYYTTDSIRTTGVVQQYTFRDKQLRAVFDKIRELCPPGWHYFVEPDGRVNLRGPQHAARHNLRVDVEIQALEVEFSIRNLKNTIHVKGRQDEDRSENDGYGSINYMAKDDESVKKYGVRETYIRDSNIKDPETAELMGEGRLEEYNRQEQLGTILIPDEKALIGTDGMLRGYNIESFRPGDMVRVLDYSNTGAKTMWNHFSWNGALWGGTPVPILPQEVPIKSIQYHSGDNAQLEVSERQPSSVGDFARLYRWLQTQSTDDD